MKTIIILLFSLALNTCGTGKDHLNKNKNITVVYKTHTRGSFNQITIANKTVSQQTTQNATPVAKTISDTQWQTYLTVIENTNLKALTTLDAPSTTFETDRAPIANLTITIGDTVYNLKPFDAGNPVSEAIDLIDMTINIANKTTD